MTTYHRRCWAKAQRAPANRSEPTNHSLIQQKKHIIWKKEVLNYKHIKAMLGEGPTSKHPSQSEPIVSHEERRRYDVGQSPTNPLQLKVSRPTPILCKKKSHTFFQTTKGDFDLNQIRRRTEIDAPAQWGNN
jgi:hypothetical protein